MHTPSSLYWYAQEKEHQLQHDLEQEELLHAAALPRPARLGARARVAHWLHALANRLEPKVLPQKASQEPSV